MSFVLFLHPKEVEVDEDEDELKELGVGEREDIADDESEDEVKKVPLRSSVCGSPCAKTPAPDSAKDLPPCSASPVEDVPVPRSSTSERILERKQAKLKKMLLNLSKIRSLYNSYLQIYR